MSKVPAYLDLLGWFLEKGQAPLKALGDFETLMFSEDTKHIRIEKPVFICGLPRAGTTILLEILAENPDVATHRYQDFPFLHTIAFQDQIHRLIPSRGNKKAERAHRDGIMVNARSPEAMEEILWSAFFKNLHDPQQCPVLDASTKNAEFEKFYADHIKKLIYVRKGKRYATKNNYNITRLSYLHKLFPDALFAILIRPPVEHVYSMLKQHRLFAAAQKEDPRALRYMRRHCHYEFGLDFRPINTGNQAAAKKILELWRQGAHAESYACYWNDVYTYLADFLDQNPAIKKQIVIVRYNSFCENPAADLKRIFEFFSLKENGLVKKWTDKIHPPSYYNIDLTEAEKDMILNVTAETAKRYWN